MKDLDRLQEVVKRLHGPPHEEVLQAEVVQEDVATVDAQDSKGTAGKGRGCGGGGVNEIDNSTKGSQQYSGSLTQGPLSGAVLC